MKRTLAILLAVLGAVTLTSELILITRSGSWPASIRALNPRRTVRSEIAGDVATIADELPA